MKASRLDQEDYEFLSVNAERASAAGLAYFDHLKEPIGRWNYIRIANELAAAVEGRRVLDWGCGYGQMTYLLRRRGFEVTPFDFAASSLPDLPLCRDLNVVSASDATELPFADQCFDAVLSCGVLEHVEESSELGDERKSLREIRRVLRSGGYFLLYYLPQRWAWQEALARRLKSDYSHPRRYSAAEIAGLLAGAGYRIERLRGATLLPRNIGAAPAGVREIYGRFGRELVGVDAALCRIPGLNLISGAFEIIARRAQFDAR